MLSNSRVKSLSVVLSPFLWSRTDLSLLRRSSLCWTRMTHHGFPLFQIITSLWKFQLHDAWFFHDYKELAYDYPQNLLKNNLVYLIFQSYVLEKGCWFLNLRKIILKEQIESIPWAKTEVILNFSIFKMIYPQKPLKNSIGKGFCQQSITI